MPVSVFTVNKELSSPKQVNYVLLVVQQARNRRVCVLFYSLNSYQLTYTDMASIPRFYTLTARQHRFFPVTVLQCAGLC